MTVQINPQAPSAILARIDEIIIELESLKVIVLDEMKHNTQRAATDPSAQNKFVPHPGSATAQLWGALGQGTVDELDEIFSYDYDYELSRR